MQRRRRPTTDFPRQMGGETSWTWFGLNPDCLKTAVGCRHVVCLFRQQQVKVQLVTQRCTAPKTSNTTSSAGIHNVLGPNGTSVDVAGKRAEKRSPKTCLQESKTWNQLAPCVLRSGPLAFQLHGNHPAYRRGFGADSQPCKLLRYHEWLLVRVSSCEQRQRVFAGVLQTFLEVLYASMSAEQALADLGTSPSQWITATFSCHC